MEKNSFLIYNDIVCSLYACRTKEDLKANFLIPLSLLIPSSYSSLLFSAFPKENSRNIQEPSSLYEMPPLCVPDSFARAEKTYIRNCREDPMLWIIRGSESTLIRESDLLPEERRLQSPLYLKCYEKYKIYDTLQYSIVKDRRFLGVLTLFRRREDSPFSENEMFFLRALGIHLNAVLDQILCGSFASKREPADLSDRILPYHLTPRETEILSLLLQYRNNGEIASLLGIKETTLQKHIQNLYRKCGVSSKWELVSSYFNPA